MHAHIIIITTRSLARSGISFVLLFLRFFETVQCIHVAADTRPARASPASPSLAARPPWPECTRHRSPRALRYLIVKKRKFAMTTAAAPSILVASVDDLPRLYQACVQRTPKTRGLELTITAAGDITISSRLAPLERQVAARHAAQHRAAHGAAQQDGGPPPDLPPAKGAQPAPPQRRSPWLQQQPARGPPTGLLAVPPSLGGSDGGRPGPPSQGINVRAPVFQIGRTAPALAPWTSTVGPDRACMMVTVRVADSGRSPPH